MTEATKRSAVETVDVRTLVPAQRRAKIFALVDDHSPAKCASSIAPRASISTTGPAISSM